MANEITIVGRLLFNTSNSASLSTTYKEDYNPPSIQADLASLIASSGVKNIIHTDQEALPLGEVNAGGGWAFFRNVGATYDVKIGVSVGDSISGTFYPFVQLKPGEYTCLRLANHNVIAQSVTGATDLQYHIQMA